MQAKDPRFLPAHDPISTKPPTKTDLQIDATLSAYMDVHMKLETDAEMERRTLVLLKVGKIFKDWVVEVGTEVLKMPEDEAKAAGGELFVSGSHKLGVREPGADIDTICVAPNFCTREHFFTTLKEQFMSHPDVTEFSAAESARVPIMSFDFEGVSIDLLFARLADNVVPAKLDILDDKILSGIDEATEKSLNGPRVTLMIYELVGKEMYPKFLIVLRCIRKWAKCRGLYGNKLGYLGGINCNLLVVLVCQLYPKASPSTLLAFFFRLYGKTWEWPNPVMINKIQQNPPNLYGEQREVWSPESNPFHVMPIITPAYPAMNSSASVSIHTRDIMKAEMARAHDIISKIISERGADWGRLFDPSDFFIKYPHYLCCHILGAGEDEESRSWMGFVESRIGRITQQLETLPLKYPVHFYPVPSKTQKSAHSICYFIGFDIDPKLVRADKNIHIDHAVYQFQLKLNDPERGFRGVRKDGCDFFVEHLRWKQLPKELIRILARRHGVCIDELLEGVRTVEDLEAIVRENYKQGITSFFITDDNMARNKHWEDFFDRLIELKENEGIEISLIIQVDTQCHRIPNFIHKARWAGVFRVFIGLENVNPDNLLAAKKRQNKITEYRKMLQAWHTSGASTWAGYILGFPGDTRESILRDMEIIKKELPLDILELFILTPLPGSEDHQKLWKQGVWMDPDLNKYDVHHRVVHHPKMSDAEFELVYREAWASYYTPEHIETVARRHGAIPGRNPAEPARFMTMFKIMFEAEGVHPLEGGGFRLKFRRDRRSGLPIEPAGVFHYKLAIETVKKLKIYIRLAWQGWRIGQKVMNDPKRHEYMDLALSPVVDEDMQNLALFAETSGGEAAVSKKRGEDLARAKIAARQNLQPTPERLEAAE